MPKVIDMWTQVGLEVRIGKVASEGGGISDYYRTEQARYAWFHENTGSMPYVNI